MSTTRSQRNEAEPPSDLDDESRDGRRARGTCLPSTRGGDDGFCDVPAMVEDCVTGRPEWAIPGQFEPV